MNPLSSVKKYIITLVWITLITTNPIFAQNATFTIKGTINNLPKNNEYHAFLYHTDNNVIDSVKIIGNSFQFKKKSNGRPHIALLTISKQNNLEDNLRNDKLTKELLITSGIYDLYIQDINAINKTRIKNAPSIQYDFIKYTSLTQNKFTELVNIQTKLQNRKLTNTEKAAAFDDLNTSILDIQKTTNNFIKTHNNSMFSLFVINLLLTGQIINADIANVYYNHLSPKLKQTSYAKEIADTIKNVQMAEPPSLKVGNTAPNFTLPSLDGTQISLSKFKNKWVLIDFWASWCGPCRVENPNLVKAYEKFKDKNFIILGVSLDEKEERWKRTIISDKLNWPQASDLKGWRSPAARLYNVNAIPANFLISPDGKIAAKDLRGNSLHKALEHFLNK